MKPVLLFSITGKQLKSAFTNALTLGQVDKLTKYKVEKKVFLSLIMDDEEDVASIEAFRVFERFESLTRDPDEPIEAYIAEFMLRLEQCEKMSLICLKKYLAFKMLHNSGASDEEKELILNRLDNPDKILDEMESLLLEQFNEVPVCDSLPENKGDLLPVEILEKIFHLLEPHDIKCVIRVCKKWFDVAGSPSLWSWVVLSVTNASVQQIPLLLTRKRLQVVSCLRVQRVDEGFFHAIAKHPRLKKIWFMGFTCNIQFYDIPPELLAKAVTNIETVEFRDFERLFMSQQHFEAVMSEILKKENKMRYLDISSNNFHRKDMKIDPILMARSFTLLTGLVISGCKMHNSQWEALCKQMISESKLRFLDMSYVELMDLEVEANVFGEAMNTLEKLEAWNIKIRNDFVDSLFSSIDTKASRLKHLSISKKSLTALNPNLLELAQGKLETLDTRY